MKSVFKVIVLLMIVFVIFTGCSTPQESSSSGSSDPQQQSDAGQVPFGGEINFTVNVVKTITENETGNIGGTFYTFWKDVKNNGTVTMYLNDIKGAVTDCWNVTRGFVTGRGWEKSNDNATRVIHYQGNYHSSYGGAFGVYGWTRNPLVEYYVCEKTGDVQGPHNSDEEKNGNDHIFLGTVYSDGDTYDIYKHLRQGFPSIEDGTPEDGCPDFWQVISVRRNPRTVGSITIANHIAAWQSLGVTLGSHNADYCYQVVFTEMWSEQNTDGTPKNNKYVSGNAYGKITDYHEIPVRIKANDNSGWLARYYYNNNILYKAPNTSYGGLDFYICHRDYSGGPLSSYVYLRSASSQEYVKVLNNKGYANSNLSNAALFIGESGPSFSLLRYTNNNKFLGANGSLYTSGNNIQIKFEYLDTNRD